MNETTTFNEWLPFDIHPTLPNRVYFKTESATPNFSLSAKIWNDENLKKGLRTEHYNYVNYLDNVSLGDGAKKIKKYIIGNTNELLVRDALMWKMAKEYLNETSPAYKTYLQGTEQDWKVNYLRQTSIDKKFGDNMLVIKFHQLDDYLFIESTDVINKLIDQIVKRFKNPSSTDTLIDIEQTANGKGFRIPYAEVFKEMQRTNNESLKWAFYVLAFEKKLIDPMTQTQLDVLVTATQANDITAGSKRIGFKELIAPLHLDNSLDSTLKLVRNKTFHAEIPETFSYWELETEETYKPLRDLLDYTPKLKTDYSAGFKKTL